MRLLILIIIVSIFAIYNVTRVVLLYELQKACLSSLFIPNVTIEGCILIFLFYSAPFCYVFLFMFPRLNSRCVLCSNGMCFVYSKFSEVFLSVNSLFRKSSW